jgi:3-hydroxyacyl-[acyl-carrier-protein] dehydratase
MRSETTLHIATDHPAFAGHFPGRPIVPGVVLLDAAVHAASQMPHSAGSCQIGSAKFLSTVGPGELLTISITGAETGSLRFDIASGERKVATGTIVFAAAP